MRRYAATSNGALPDQCQAVGRGLEELGVLRKKLAEEPLVVSLADECGLEADAADIDTKRGHGCETWSSLGGPQPRRLQRLPMRRRPGQTGA